MAMGSLKFLFSYCGCNSSACTGYTAQSVRKNSTSWHCSKQAALDPLGRLRRVRTVVVRPA